MPTQKSRSVGGADGGASGAKGRALRGEIASRSAVDWLGRPTNGDYRALRNSGWRKDGNLVDRQMADGYLGRRADGETACRVDAAECQPKNHGASEGRTEGRLARKAARCEGKLPHGARSIGLEGRQTAIIARCEIRVGAQTVT